jgi:3-dehydroquinate synthase
LRTVNVALGDRSYDVHVGDGALAKSAGLVPELPHVCERVAIVSDANVDRAWGDTAAEALAPLGSTGEVVRLVVDAGETSKSLEAAGGLLEEMAGLRLRRSDLLVALGGGMVGDLAGFAASIYQRGMALVQAPTSLLAQVDAAIGGKTAVNLSAGKNLAGTFYQPRAVIADTATLQTLPEREYLSGLAEVAKYGFSLDPELLADVEKNTKALRARDPDVLEDIVARSVAIKASIVAADERDLDDRRIMLNYGHTLAHALEALGGYQQWLHGEAVSVGLVFASALARELGHLTKEEAERHRTVLLGLGLPVSAAFDPAAIEAAWTMDKKYRGGVRWVLLKGFGDPFVTANVHSPELSRAMRSVLPE